NKDTQFSDFLIAESEKFRLEPVTYGINSSADIHPDSYSLTENSIALAFDSIELSIPLYGIHNVSNVVAAIAVAQKMGMKLEEISESLKSFENVDGRSSVINHGFKIIDDTYNANPLSMRSALESVREIYPENRKIAVLSDMKELGSDELKLHESTGEEVAESDFDCLLLWGEMSSAYKNGAINGGMSDQKVHIFGTKDALVRYLKSIINKDDVVLIKGSRSMRMEDVVKAL
ncbi:MAG: Mur ligase family protein, partial [Bacteroidales bacterium]|nr:Mur ligase family protein [Bacteroidales bacterium]